MDPILVVAIILLAFEAAYNAVEFSMVYRVRKDKAKFVEAHSQIGEGSELVAFLVAGVLLYLSDVNLISVGIVLLLGIYHLMPTITNKDRMLKMSDGLIRKMPLFVMIMCATEVVLSIYVISTVIPLL